MAADPELPGRLRILWCESLSGTQSLAVNRLSFRIVLQQADGLFKRRPQERTELASFRLCLFGPSHNVAAHGRPRCRSPGRDCCVSTHTGKAPRGRAARPIASTSHEPAGRIGRPRGSACRVRALADRNASDNRWPTTISRLTFDPWRVLATSPRGCWRDGCTAGRIRGGDGGSPGDGGATSPPTRPSWWTLLLFSGLALLPDLDVLLVALGACDTGVCGHRGFSHSLPFAIAIGLLGGLIARRRGWPAIRTVIATALAVGSHASLDLLGEGGRGLPLLWPFSETGSTLRSGSFRMPPGASRSCPCPGP